MMGGDVTVTSEPGKGSAFTVRLPGGARGMGVADRVRRIGLLMGVADDREGQARVTALKQGLRLGNRATNARRRPLCCRGMSSPPPSAAQVLKRASVKFAIHK
jgi:hypothetical protein